MAVAAQKQQPVRAGYKRTEMGLIPEDWKMIDLSDLCTLQRGFDITEATRVAGSIPVYSSSGLSYYHNKALHLLRVSSRAERESSEGSS
jgi:hypothetical protein